MPNLIGTMPTFNQSSPLPETGNASDQSVKKIVDATALWIVEMFIPHGSQDAANLLILKDVLRQAIKSAHKR